jgi:hypothetical protein
MTEIVAPADKYSEGSDILAESTTGSKLKQYFSNYASRKVKEDEAAEDDVETQISFGKTQFVPSNRPKLTWEDDMVHSPSDKDYLVEDNIYLKRNRPFFAIRLDDPRHYGNCIPFCYVRGEPMCLLGPDCRIGIPLGPFSVGLLMVVLTFLSSMESVLIRPNWPKLSFGIFILMKYAYVTILCSLIVKNPGVMSQCKSVTYLEDTL